MRSLLASLVALNLASVASGQVFAVREPRLRDQWTFGANFLGGISVGEFRHSESGGAGGQLALGFQPFRREPLVLRAQVGTLVYGTASAYGYQDVCDATSCWTEQVRYNARNHTMSFVH